MAPSGNASLASLLSRTSLDDHEELLAASEAALKSSRSDVQAQHVKAVALLKLDRYQDAVSFFESVGNSLKDAAPLEYAYALYKAGKLEEAIKVAANLSEDRGAKHVEAQARYRLEDFDRTAEIYRELSNEDVATDQYSMKVNQGAIDAQGQWLGLLDAANARRPDRDDLAAFDTAYNAACGSIARGELTQAEVLLKRAKTLCQHSEELTDKEKKEELLPIVVQQAYVLYRQGKTEEAESIVNDIDVNEISDLPTRTIAINNQLLSPAVQANPFIVYKKFNSIPESPQSNEFFSYQSIPLSSNEKTVVLNSLKFEGLTKSTRQKITKQSSSTSLSEQLLQSAFNAASLAKNQVGRAAINKVSPELEKRPADLGLTMTLIQMHVRLGDLTSAIGLVESLMKRLEESKETHEQELRYHPGLVSVATALYRMQGRTEHIKAELAKAAAYWKQKPQPPITLLRAAGISLLASSNTEGEDMASQIFDKLYEKSPNDMATIAGYVASHALSDPNSVKELATKLKPVSDLISDVDVNALESTGIPQASNALAIAQAGISKKRAHPSGAEVGRTKRVRKSRLPKNYDPSSESKPDPERWLPMRDRSYYRPPKGKKKGKKSDDRTQGGAVSEELDVNKQPQKGGEVVSGGGGGGAKKKKKGKK